MRINGPVLRPSTLAERRLLLGHFGVTFLRVSRSQNPYAVARKIRRLVDKNEDLLFFKALAARSRRPVIPPLSPGVDVPEPALKDDDVVAAAE